MILLGITICPLIILSLLFSHQIISTQNEMFWRLTLSNLMIIFVSFLVCIDLPYLLIMVFIVKKSFHP